MLRFCVKIYAIPTLAARHLFASVVGHALYFVTKKVESVLLKKPPDVIYGPSGLETALGVGSNKLRIYRQYAVAVLGNLRIYQQRVDD